MARSEDVTSDLSQFGARELISLRDLLTAYIDKNKTHFLGSGVVPMFNKNSGNVFLTDEDYNVAMAYDGELLDFFSSPYEGREGTFDELKDEYRDMHPEDKEWLRDIAKTLGKKLPKR